MTLILRNNTELVTTDESAFQQIIDMTLSTVADSTRRVYERSYQQWLAYARDNGVSPFDLKAQYVGDFVNRLPVTRRTRQRVLSAMRKLVRVLITEDSRYMPLYEGLKLVQASGTDTDNSRKQERRALDIKQVHKVLSAFGGNTLRDLRNRALLYIMFYTGARRSEVVNLQWSHIDFDKGTIDIYEGKGDKDRTVSIVGNETLEVLRNWQRALFMADGIRRYVFCEFRKGDTLQGDTPISGTSAYRVVKEAESVSGVTFKPHDARRTLATELLINGASVQDVQAQLGHSDASTTINNYAKPADAVTRRTRFKTRF